MKTIISILTVFGIQLLYAAILYIVHKYSEYFLHSSVFLIILAIILYYFLCVKGHVYWFILPLSWILCIGHSLYYSYIISKAGFFGRDFTFGGILILNNLPVIIVSVILAIINRFILQKQ